VSYWASPPAPGTAAGRYREWLAAGSPPAPGRLNEACHMVFKPLDRPWRRARAGIAALLKADLFREGIDGEAVDWACERLLAKEARRRILIVISDGCPNDAATRRANDAFYLDNHLKEVVARREQQGAVEVLGLRRRPRPQPLLPALPGD
jgi:cobaltochelatase CobT